MPRVWAAVLAAGAGQRMGASIPKQYLKLNQQPLLQVTLSIFERLPDLQGILLVLAPHDNHVDQLNISTKVTRITGGSERAQSALNALTYLMNAGCGQDWILMHDGARPCTRPRAIQALIKQAIDGQQQIPPLQGAILAVPVADTLKQSQNNKIIATVDRAHLWAAHTPQMFQIAYLHQAILNAMKNGVPVTDEASAVEYAGGQIALVLDSRDNIKVTRAEDLYLAEYILQQQINDKE